MADVEHMKWWGWGVPDHAFTADNKPKFAPFVYEKVGIDVTVPAPPPPGFDSLTVPPSILDDSLRAALTAAVGAENVHTDDMDRVVHTYGKGVRDLVRIRRGDLGRVPDAVVYPGEEAEVVAVVNLVTEHDVVLIPFGGGSNIVSALEAVPGETRTVISLDMGRMNKVLDIDAESGLARIEAGALGPHLEEQLAAQGWTMGHFPDSFTHSTLGGWIATRSSGMQSDKYGDIADITRGLRVVLPDGEVMVLRALPSYSSGPSVREMILGSEGRLGVITEATVNVHRIPEVREIQAYFFPSYKAGLDAMREISESDAEPTVTRVSDAYETAFSLATGKKSKGISKWVTKALTEYMKRTGWDLSELCLSFIGFEGSPVHVRYEKSLVSKIVKRHGGLGVGTGPGALYDQKKFDTPYIRDFLLDRGAMADVSETASPWSVMFDLHETVVSRFHETLDRLGVRGYIMCHLSHSYHSGACQYFTFAVVNSGPNALDTYDALKQVIQQTFVDLPATVSHHHGVGEEHSPWIEADISPGGVKVQRALFDAVDPGNNFNPGKIVHDGVPGVSSNSTQP